MKQNDDNYATINICGTNRKFQRPDLYVDFKWDIAKLQYQGVWSITLSKCCQGKMHRGNFIPKMTELWK